MKEVLYFVTVFSVCVGGLSEVNVIEDFDEEGYIGNPDNFDKIERPCDIYDINCIRMFFSKHAHCQIVDGPLPDIVYRSQNTINFPRINVTVTQNNAMIMGLNATRIEEFYINRATNKVVFAIQIPNVAVVSPSGYFRFYRKGREPITAVGETEIIYRSMTFTAVIDNIDDMRLDKAEVTTYAGDPNPPFVIGPTVANNPDPVVVQAMVELLGDVSTDVQEAMLTEGQFFPPAYIQLNICDFGLKLV